MARAVKKTATYSVMHMVVAIGVAFALTGSWVVAVGIGLIEPMVQTIAYHVHEKAWSFSDPQSHSNRKEIVNTAQAAA